MPEKTIRELGGEIWSEITMEKQFNSSSQINLIPFEADDALIELIMGVLARHENSKIVNDKDFPVAPRTQRFKEHNAD